MLRKFEKIKKEKRSTPLEHCCTVKNHISLFLSIYEEKVTVNKNDKITKENITILY